MELKARYLHKMSRIADPHECEHDLKHLSLHFEYQTCIRQDLNTVSRIDIMYLT